MSKKETAKNQKTVIKTGFYSLIGKQIARELSGLGMTVIGIGRNSHKAGDAMNEIIEETGNKEISFIKCDLTDVIQIQEA